MITEEYRQLAEYPNYEISNYGHIKNQHGKQLKPYSNWSNKGYLKVKLLNKDGDSKQEYIHRLVAECFLPNPNNLPQINHLDNNGQNNFFNNLEWCTAKENGAFKKVSQFFTFDTTPPPMDLTRFMQGCI